MLAMMGSTEFTGLLVIGLLVALLPTIACCKIAQRLGWPPAIGLLWLIPLGNVVLLCVLGFADPPKRQIL